MRRLKFLAPIVCAVALFAVPSSAFAASDTTNITVNGGTLDYTTPFTAGDFPSVTLNGLTQVKNATVNNWAVSDNRGSSAGWHVTIGASQFTCSTSGTCGSSTFPSSSLLVASLGVPTTDPSNLVNGSLIPPVYSLLAATPIDDGNTHALASAAALPLSGTGTWTFTHAGAGLALTVPASTSPGTYTSTITTTLASGP
jgi:hypothetical protein